jgi:HEAT repeat protein
MKNQKTVAHRPNVRGQLRRASQLTLEQALALMGSSLLVVGVFLPLVHVPILGDINYIRRGQGDGIIILVLAATTGVLAFTRWLRGLWLTGHAALALLAFTFTHLQMAFAEVSEISPTHASALDTNLAAVALETVTLQWGWAVLLLGATLIVAGATTWEVRHTPAKRGLFRVLGAASIPAMLVFSGTGTWAVTRLSQLLKQEIARQELEANLARRDEALRRASQEALEREAQEKAEAERVRQEAREKARREAAERAATTQIVVRLDNKSVVPNAGEWPDSSVYAVQQGNLRVSVGLVRVLPSEMELLLELENAGDRDDISLPIWANGYNSDHIRLTDQAGNEYPQQKLATLPGISRLVPRASHTERLQFPLSSGEIQFLNVDLDASAFGGKGRLHLKVPEKDLTFVNARMSPARVLPGLRAALHDARPRIREQAASTIGQIGPAAVEACADVLQAVKDSSTAVRIAAIKALPVLGASPSTVLPVLLEALNDEDSQVASLAESALESQKPLNEKDVPVLSEALRSPTERAKCSALRSLIDLGTRGRSARVQVRQLLSDPSAQVRSTAITALYSIQPNNSETVDALGAALRDSSIAVRSNAAQALSKMTSVQGGTAALIEALKDQSIDVGTIASESLLRVAHFTKLDAQRLASCLKDPRTSVRLPAAQSLEKAGASAKPAVPVLIETLRDPDKDVRKASAAALGNVGAEAWTAAAPLGAVLADSEVSVRIAAVGAIRKLGPEGKKAVPQLLIALADPAINQQVGDTLMAMGKGAVPLIVDGLESRDRHQRIRIIKVLGRMGNSAVEALPALSAVAEKDYYVQVRRVAQEAIAQIGKAP